MPISKKWQPGEGHSTFFQVGVCGPDFRSGGLQTNTYFWKGGGLWTENFQILGLVNWKFLNLGACELKISKFGGLWAKILAKIEAVEANISKFSQKGVLWTEMGPLQTTGEVWKGVFRAAHPHTPFLGQCPPGSDSFPANFMHIVHVFLCIVAIPVGLTNVILIALRVR